ncbi:restriction endonuclease [Streptomyces roseoverticillatus]|uniref:restriction endonuclease n=1 Tax=Streptomyces roseoverticillatus TaxID=66429 RepID=UPI001F24DA72|nr:restriction endonuclease [Streptomyces roseoverticillatus]MCF3105350.1 restriction endonuclease [Streptomyces roseoverticillatus]
MHINWNTNVTLPVYEDAEMNAALREAIRAATDDDLLAAYLHHAEGEVTIEVFDRFIALREEVEREYEHTLKLDDGPESPQIYAFRQAHLRLHQELRELRDQARSAVSTASDVWYGLRAATVQGNLTGRFQRDAEASEPVIEKIGPLLQELPAVQQQLSAVLAEHRDEMHRLALEEATFHAFTATSDSISPGEFDAMTPLEFEQATAHLAKRDGYELLQHHGKANDRGADVIATTPDTRRIVFQCKHRQPGGRPVGSEDLQKFNGTARPEHHGDLAVLVTNSSFTKPARDFAAKHNIHLLHGEHLRRWATWGIPLLTVLNEDEGPQQNAAA